MRAVALLSVTGLLFVLEGCKGCSDQELKPVGGSDQDEEEQEDPHDIGSWLSMEAMPDGRLAVAYYDRTKDALGFALGTVSGQDVTWAKEEVDSYPDEEGLNPGDAGKYASLAVTADGVAWVAYQDTSNGTLKYATRATDGTWTVGVADVGGGPSSDAGYWASVALDASGNPVVAHYDHGKGDLRVARWNGTAFSGGVVYEGEDYVPTDGSATVEGDAGEYAKLYVAADGTEYLAFYDRAHGALRLASGGSAGFTVEVVDDSADVGQWPDIAVDGSSVWIAYQDVTAQDLELASGRPGSWTTETVDAGDYVGADAAIFLSGTTPAIFYFDGVANDMKLATKRDGAWVGETVTGADVAAGFHNETVDLGGTRWAASYDYTNRTIWAGHL